MTPKAIFPLLHPASFAAAYVLSNYLDAAEFVEAATRALVVTVAAALGTAVIVTAVTRDARQGAFAATLGLAFLVSPTAGVSLILVAAIPLLYNRLRFGCLGRIDWPTTTRFLNVVAMIALALNAVPTMQRASAQPPSDRTPATTTPDAEQPDVFLIMLDGYPRADTLRDTFGYDNSAFLGELSELGFEVAEEAHSNYNATLLTLASLFNARHINELLPSPPPLKIQPIALLTSINAGSMISELHRAGYVVVSVPSGYSGMSFYNADRYLDVGPITTFEVSILNSTTVRAVAEEPLTSWLYQQQRDRLIGITSTLGQLSRESSSVPRFVFAHLMSPHPPIVFNADGSPRDGYECGGCASLWSQVHGPEEDQMIVGQIVHTNRLLLSAVREILAGSSRPTVIVIFSDHGSRHSLTDTGERFKNLLVSLTPERPGLFPSDASPVNIIPRILNGYSGASLSLASEESYDLDLVAVPDQGYFPLTPRRE